MAKFTAPQLVQIDGRFPFENDLDFTTLFAFNKFIAETMEHPFTEEVFDDLLNNLYLKNFVNGVLCPLANKYNHNTADKQKSIIIAVNRVMEDHRTLEIESKIALQALLITTLCQDLCFPLISQKNLDSDILFDCISRALIAASQESKVDEQAFQENLQHFLSSPTKSIPLVTSSEVTPKTGEAGPHGPGTHLSLAVRKPITMDEIISKISSSATQTPAPSTSAPQTQSSVNVHFTNNIAWTSAHYAIAPYLLPLLQNKWDEIQTAFAALNDLYIFDMRRENNGDITIEYGNAADTTLPRSVVIAKADVEQLYNLFSIIENNERQLLLPEVQQRYGHLTMADDGNHPLKKLLTSNQNNFVNDQTAMPPRQQLQKAQIVNAHNNTEGKPIFQLARDVCNTYLTVLTAPWKKKEKEDATALYQRTQTAKAALLPHMPEAHAYQLREKLLDYQTRISHGWRWLVTARGRKKQVESALTSMDDNKLAALEKIYHTRYDASRGATRKKNATGEVIYKSELWQISNDYLQSQQQQHRKLLRQWLTSPLPAPEIIPLLLGKNKAGQDRTVASLNGHMAQALGLLFGPKERTEIKADIEAWLKKALPEDPRFELINEIVHVFYSDDVQLIEQVEARRYVPNLLRKGENGKILTALKNAADVDRGRVEKACEEMAVTLNIKENPGATGTFEQRLWLLIGGLCKLDAYNPPPPQLILMLLNTAYENVLAELERLKASDDKLGFFVAVQNLFEKEAVKELEGYLQRYEIGKNPLAGESTLAALHDKINKLLDDGVKTYFTEINTRIISGSRDEKNTAFAQAKHFMQDNNAQINFTTCAWSNENQQLVKESIIYSRSSGALLLSPACTTMMDNYLTTITVDTAHISQLEELRQLAKNLPVSKALKNISNKYIKLCFELISTGTPDQISVAKKILEDIVNGKPLFSVYNNAPIGVKTDVVTQLHLLIREGIYSQGLAFKKLINNAWLMKCLPEERENFIVTFEKTSAGQMVLQNFFTNIKKMIEGKLEKTDYLSFDLANDFACCFSPTTIKRLRDALDRLPTDASEGSSTQTPLLTPEEVIFSGNLRDIHTKLQTLPEFGKAIYRGFLDQVVVYQEGYKNVVKEIRENNQKFTEGQISGKIDEVTLEKPNFFENGSIYFHHIFPAQQFLYAILAADLKTKEPKTLAKELSAGFASMVVAVNSLKKEPISVLANDTLIKMLEDLKSVFQKIIIEIDDESRKTVILEFVNAFYKTQAEATRNGIPELQAQVFSQLATLFLTGKIDASQLKTALSTLTGEEDVQCVWEKIGNYHQALSEVEQAQINEKLQHAQQTLQTQLEEMKIDNDKVLPDISLTKTQKVTKFLGSLSPKKQPVAPSPYPTQAPKPHVDITHCFMLANLKKIVDKTAGETLLIAVLMKLSNDALLTFIYNAKQKVNTVERDYFNQVTTLSAENTAPLWERLEIILKEKEKEAKMGAKHDLTAELGAIKDAINDLKPIEEKKKSAPSTRAMSPEVLETPRKKKKEGARRKGKRSPIKLTYGKDPTFVPEASMKSSGSPLPVSPTKAQPASTPPRVGSFGNLG